MKLAFSQVVAASVQDLEHCVAQVEDAELWDAAGVVVKVRAALWRRFISLDADTSNDLELAHDALERRASGLKIFLLPDAHELCSDEGTPYRLELPACIQIVFREAQVSLEPTSGNELELIRQADLEKALRSQFDRCLVRASENHHFALPSGAHASLFIRLAEAFVDLSIVDLIAFWSALRIISDHPGRRRDSFDLVVDHPSMLVLGLRVARFFHRVNVISLPSYSTDVKTRTEIIRSLKALGTGNVVLLIGIASTGRLASS